MPTSRKNKNRSENLLKFKKSKKVKMEKSTPVEVKPNLRIAKRPTWQTNETFQIGGSELEFLANFFMPYREAVAMVDRIIATAELEDKITTELLYEDGTEVPDTDPRKEEIVKKDKERIDSWKKIVQERQEQIMEASNKAKEALDKMENNTNLENTPAETIAEENKPEGKEIAFTPQSIH